jgi:hypothetical protein
MRQDWDTAESALVVEKGRDRERGYSEVGAASLWFEGDKIIERKGMETKKRCISASAPRFVLEDREFGYDGAREAYVIIGGGEA